MTNVSRNFVCTQIRRANNCSFTAEKIRDDSRRIKGPMRRMMKCFTLTLTVILLALAVTSRIATPETVAAQAPASTYQPKFPGDPARSDSEAAALAYMRVVLRAQRQFNKQYGHFATSLTELVHSGSFTKRMVDPNRGDYTAGFKGKKDSFILV